MIITNVKTKLILIIVFISIITCFCKIGIAKESPNVSTDKEIYNYGESIKIYFSNAIGNSSDWICIVPEGAPNDEAGVYQNLPKGLSQGTLTFNAPLPGRYEVRVYYDYNKRGYVVSDRCKFSVAKTPEGEAASLRIVKPLSGSGAADRGKYIESQKKVDQILAQPVKLTKLPVKVKVTIDEKSKNLVLEKNPRGFAGRSRTVHLPIGQQIVDSVNRCADMLFDQFKENGEYDINFYVDIISFDDEHEFFTSMLSTGILYDMRLIIDTKLQSRNGSVIYQKRSIIDLSGYANLGFSSIDAGGAMGKGMADIATLWEIDLMKDISQNKHVLEFAKAKTSTLSASAGPDILIPGHLNGMSTNDDFFQLTGEIQATIPVKKISISVNGKPIEKLQGLNKTPDSGTMTINQAIPLSAGENVIAVTAIDKDGGTSQKVIKITREQKGIVADTDIRSKIGDKYAVVVGISEYKNKIKGIASIINAAEEAKQFTRFIKSPQGGNFKDSNVLLLTNEKATSSALRRALFTFLKKAIEEDLVIFFFSGQGAYEMGNTDNYYLLTHDADLEDLPTSSIPVWDIENAFKRNIKARRAVIFMDAQHVSKLAKDDSTRGIAIKGNIINKYLKSLAEAGEGKVIINAAQENQTSSGGSDRENGARFFTQCLLKALNGNADKNGDGIVSLGEVIDYTTDCVDTASNGKQRPDVTGRYDRNLPLAVIK